MSKATNQSILLLAIVRTCFLIIESDGNVPDELAPTFVYASGLSEKVVNSFPSTGNGHKNAKWRKDVVNRWKDMGDEMQEWHPLVITTFCNNILDDLLGVLRDKEKRKMVQELRDATIPIGYYDYGVKDEYMHYAEADKLLEEVYGLMEFSR